MEVIVDGIPGVPGTGGGQDLLAALSNVSDSLRERGRTILAIKVDGENIPPEGLMQRLEGLSSNDVNRVEIASEDLSTLISKSLGQLDAVLKELPLACRKLAEIFQGENPEQGFEPFHRLADVWHQLKSRQVLVMNALDTSPEHLAVGGVSLAQLHDELNSFLKQILDGIAAGDCVLLGDLLEYELAPRAEKETEIVAMLEARASALRDGQPCGA